MNHQTKELLNVVDVQVAAWREQMLNRLLPLTAAIATVGIVVGIISVVEREKWIYLPIYVGVYFLLLLITLVQRLTYRVRARVLLFLIGTMGVVVLSETGLGGEGRSFLLVLPIAAMALLGWRSGLLGLLLSISIIVGFGGLVSAGVIRITVDSQVYTGDMIAWVLAATLTAMLVIGVITAFRTILENLTATLHKEQRARRQLHEVSDHLEHKSAVRSRALERCTELLSISVEMSRAAVELPEMDQLLQAAAGLMVNQAGYCHANVYWLSSEGKACELRAAVGELAEHLLAEGGPEPVGDDSIAGRCLATGQSQIVGGRSDFSQARLLGIRSAIALPLRTGRQTQGVLELYSDGPAALSDRDLAAMQMTADQLAAVAVLSQRAHQIPAAQGRAGTGPLAKDFELGQDGQERMLAEVTGRIRASLDPDTILKTAVRELGRLVGAAQTSVEVVPPGGNGGRPAETRGGE